MVKLGGLFNAMLEGHKMRKRHSMPQADSPLKEPASVVPAVKKIACMNRQTIEETELETGTIVIAIRAHGYRKANIKGDVAAVLDVEVDNLEEPMGYNGYICPSRKIVEPIWTWWQEWRVKATKLIVQCESGIDRSYAVAAAIVKLEGGDPDAAFLRHGTHNRLLYKEMLTGAGLQLSLEKLVSIMVVPQWPLDRLEAFYLCMKRQRYDNWQLVICTDGLRPDIKKWHKRLDKNYKSRVKLVETTNHSGNFGHVVRQIGIDACDGEIIGLQNIDNYLTPGYIEQLVWALDDGVDLALCDTVHNYQSYSVQDSKPCIFGADMGCFLARASLVKQVPWPGIEIWADGQYIEALFAKAGCKAMKVSRPLWTHN